MNKKKKREISQLGDIFNYDNERFIVISYEKTWEGYYILKIVHEEDFKKYYGKV